MGRKNKQKQKNTTRQINSVPYSFPRYLFSLLGIIGETILLPLKIGLHFLLFFTKPRLYRKLFQLSHIACRIIFYVSRTLLHLFRIQMAYIGLRVRFIITRTLRFRLTRHHHIPKKKTIFVAQPQDKKQRLYSLFKAPIFLPRRTKSSSLPKPLKTRIPLLTRLIYITFGGAMVFFLIVIPLGLYMLVKALPNPELLRTRDIPVTTKIFDRHGILLYEIYTDENRTPLPLSEIPDIVKNATVAIEDKNFYHHNGFSITGITRAAWETIFHKQLQGGSTITQQLIKSTLLTSEITVSRKIKELILAFWTEQLYTKNQILEMYLNQVSYGGTAWGIESASQTYFGISIKQATLAQAAFLSGLPQAPSDYSPFSGSKDKAIERQHSVLRRMVEDGYISQEDEEKAQSEQLTFISPRTPIKAPHFVWYVKEYLEKKYGEHLVEKGGLQVTTTLDIEMQDKVQSIVASQVSSLAPLQVGNGAALVTDPNTGEILAMVGSKEYFDTAHDGNVNVTTSLRQPGSSIKVVTYAKALENKSVTATTLLEDLPVSYPIIGQPPYAPVNYDGRFHGWVPVRLALANSYNIPAVRLLNTVGVDSMIEQAKRMGIDTWTERNRYGLSLTLGGGEVRMTDMAEVYGTFANEGKRVDLTAIRSITDYAGHEIEKGPQSNTIQAISSEVAWIMGNILSDNWARSSAFGPNSQLVIPGKTVSVKTGTTNDKRDNWTIGYTPSFVVTVWVGNNDNTPMNPYLTSGITGASPIWHDVVVELLKNKSDEVNPKPDTVISIPCYGNKTEFFIRGTEPKDNRCGFIPTLAPSPSPKQVQISSPLTDLYERAKIKRKQKR